MLDVAIVHIPLCSSANCYFYIRKFLSKHEYHHTFFAAQTVGTNDNWFSISRGSTDCHKKEATERTRQPYKISNTVIQPLTSADTEGVIENDFACCVRHPPFHSDVARRPSNGNSLRKYFRRPQSAGCFVLVCLFYQCQQNFQCFLCTSSKKFA